MNSVYRFIAKSVNKLDGTYKQYFIEDRLQIILEIYTHALSSQTYDYWITAGNSGPRAYLNSGCKTKDELIDKIYDSYVKDFCKYDEMLNDPLLYAGYLNNKIYNLELELKMQKNARQEMKEELQKMTEKVNSLSLYNSVLEDNDRLRKENATLKSQLQQEKADHTMTKCRSIFAIHVLNGNRDERVEEFKIEHKIK
jgi:hypothetical protein